MKRLPIILTFIVILNAAWSQERTFEFRNIGPSRGGRVTAVEGVDLQPNLFYMGASGGGLWKTEDYGIHWENISDGFFTTPSIGAIAVYLKDPNVIYVGTGSEAIRSNVIVGKGIYKSTDAGKTWSLSGLKEAGQIGAVEVHPNDPNRVYAAVVGQPFRKSSERGVYRSDDGGQTWKNILHHSDSVGAVDLEFAPGNPEIIYASMWRGERKPWTIMSGGASDGIFKSTDGGDSWKRLRKGLPTSLFGKSDLAVSRDNPAEFGHKFKHQMVKKVFIVQMTMGKAGQRLKCQKMCISLSCTDLSTSRILMQILKTRTTSGREPSSFGPPMMVVFPGKKWCPHMQIITIFG